MIKGGMTIKKVDIVTVFTIKHLKLLRNFAFEMKLNVSSLLWLMKLVPLACFAKHAPGT